MQHTPLALTPSSVLSANNSWTLKRFIYLYLAILCRIISSPFRFLGLKSIADFIQFYGRKFHARGNAQPDPKYQVKSELIETPSREPGIVLSGILFTPIMKEKKKLPAVLIRTPYGKNSLGKDWARTMAEQGYLALIQDTRGRFGSGGDFFPVKHEIEDGGATVDWLQQHELCNGKVGAFGVSYLGLTSYAAVGGSSAGKCSAIVPIMASARMYPILFNNTGALAVDLILRWLYIVLVVMKSSPLSALLKLIYPAELNQALNEHRIPLSMQDEKLLGGNKLGFFQDVIRATDEKHEFWTELDTLCDLSDPNHCPPIHVVAGWYDFFVKQSFQDWLKAKKTAEQNPNIKSTAMLTVGPWSHWDLPWYVATSMNITMEWFNRYLRGEKDAQQDRPQINVFVLGSNPGQWLSFYEWPPSQSQSVMYLLNEKGTLSDTHIDSKQKPFTEHLYDPYYPTPNVGGPSFDFMNSGRMEQSSLEVRDDVLVFTSAPMKEDTYIVGNINATIYLWSSNQNTDIFAKICDVDKYDKSYNLTESIIRLGSNHWKNSSVGDPSQGIAKIDFEIGAIAVMIPAGHRIRIQLSGGAHPLIMRHHGTENLGAEEINLQPATRRVYHSREYPSGIYIPIFDMSYATPSRL